MNFLILLIAAVFGFNTVTDKDNSNAKKQDGIKIEQSTMKSFFHS